jgi:hypothetical protein
MSQFDKLSLELVTRPSISDSERLGLAELQLQRARRMHLLMIGDEPETTSETVQQLARVRDETLAALLKKQQRQRELAEIERLQLAKEEIHDVQEQEKPAVANTRSRTPTPASTPANKDESPAPAATGAAAAPVTPALAVAGAAPKQA